METYTFSSMEHKKGEFAVLFYSQGIDSFDIKNDKKYIGEVFAGVKKSIHSLIKEKNVKMFWFNAKEPKLIQLYDIIIPRMKKEFDIFDYNGSVVKNGVKFWIFERKQKK